MANQTYPQRPDVLTTEQADAMQKFGRQLIEGNRAILEVHRLRTVLKQISDASGFGTGDREFMIQKYRQLANDALRSE